MPQDVVLQDHKADAIEEETTAAEEAVPSWRMSPGRRKESDFRQTTEAEAKEAKPYEFKHRERLRDFYEEFVLANEPETSLIVYFFSPTRIEQLLPGAQFLRFYSSKKDAKDAASDYYEILFLYKQQVLVRTTWLTCPTKSPAERLVNDASAKTSFNSNRDIKQGLSMLKGSFGGGSTAAGGSDKLSERESLKVESSGSTPSTASLQLPPNKPGSSKLLAQKKSEMLRKEVLVSFFSAEPLQSEDVNTIVKTLRDCVQAKALEKNSAATRKLNYMPINSPISRYFLSEGGCEEYDFQCPKLIDRTSMLLLLKFYFLLFFGKVSGTMDHDLAMKQHDYSFFDEPEASPSLDAAVALDPPLQASVQMSSAMTTSDSYFFYSFEDNNKIDFGKLFFFLNIVENNDNFELKYFKEFETTDSCYMTLLDHHALARTAAPLLFAHHEIKPNPSFLNSIHDIRYLESGQSPGKDCTAFSFRVHGRQMPLKEKMISYLESALTNAFIELVLDQWIHSMYLKPLEHWKVCTTEDDIRNTLEQLQASKCAPKSMSQKSISHKIRTVTYYKEFVHQILMTIQKEIDIARKGKVLEGSCVSFCYEKKSGEKKLLENSDRLNEFLKQEFVIDQTDMQLLLENQADYSAKEVKLSLHPHVDRVESKELKDESSDHYNASPIANHPLSTSLSPSGPRSIILERMNSQNFDISKTILERHDKFSLLMKEKPMVNQGAEFLNYTTLSGVQERAFHFKEGKAGDSKSLIVPAKRVFLWIDVTAKGVAVMSYNVKEEILLKLYERVAEEVTFHEMRELLVLGLTSSRMMRRLSESNCIVEEFFRRLAERNEIVEEGARKWRLEKSELKDVHTKRFTLSKPQGDESTLTEGVYSLLECKSNGAMKECLQLKFAHAGAIKRKLDDVVAIVKSIRRKMRNERLEIEFLADRKHLLPPSSRSHSTSTVSSGRVSMKSLQECNLSEGNRKDDSDVEDFEEPAVGKRTKNSQTASMTPKPNMRQLPKLQQQKSSKKSFGEYDGEAKDKTEVQDWKNRRLPSVEKTAEKRQEQLVEADLTMDELVGCAKANLERLKANFCEHLEDVKVKLMLDAEEAQRIPIFLKICDSRIHC